MWCQVQATSAVSGRGCPLVRSKHAMCVTPDGHIYLYGGRSMANQALRDLWRFDTGQNQWEEVSSRNDNHECLTTSGSIHCKSGQNHQNYSQAYLSHYRQSGNDHHHHHSSSLSSRSSSSNSSSSGTSPPLSPYDNQHEPPPPLQEHTIIAAKNKLYIFGGEVGYSSDETPLWIFDLATARWSKLSLKSSSTSPTCIATSPSSQYATSRPLGCRGHTAVCYKNLMCIYGGYQDLKGSSSELWTFHLDHEEWSLEANSNKKSSNPAPRHAHSAVVYRESMYIYGGMTDLQIRNDFWSWNFRTKEWHRIKTVRNPSELSGHSAIVVLDSMFIYGGESGNGNSKNELWRYRFSTQHWENIVIDGIVPGNRTRHVALSNPFLNYFGSNSFGNGLEGADVERKASRMLFSKNRNKKKTKHKKQCKLSADDYETSFISGAITDTEDFKSNNDYDDNCQKKEVEPKKSISLCFDSLDDANSSILSPEDSGDKRVVAIKSNSFRRAGVDAENGGRRSPMLMTAPSLCQRDIKTLSDEENDDEFIEMDEFNSSIVSQNQHKSKQAHIHRDISNIENDKNLKNIEANIINNISNNNNKNQNTANRNNASNDSSNANNDGVVVRMRPRRPALQKQRPYSDFYATIQNCHHHPFYQGIDETFDDSTQTNEKQFKRRSVQESMSYYSLCFATPPASLKLNRSPTTAMVPPMSPLLEPFESTSHQAAPLASGSLVNKPQLELSAPQPCSKTVIDNHLHRHYHNDEKPKPECNDTPDQEVIIRRRENSSIKRRMRRANLELRELNSTMMMSSTESGHYNSAYYSLSLDISPDFEKELKCGTALSTPSNNNGLTGPSTMENYNSCYDHEDNMGHIDLDLLEDYLEPEEMLEIVTESTNDDNEISPTLNIKTIQKTPARTRGKLERNLGSKQSKQSHQQPGHSSSTASVSHSSSGYQSLVLADGNGTGSFDLMSNPSLSNSSSFVEHEHDQDFTQNLHRSLARSITNNLNDNSDSLSNQKQQTEHQKQQRRVDDIKLGQMKLPLNQHCQQQRQTETQNQLRSKSRRKDSVVVIASSSSSRARSLDRVPESRHNRSSQNSHHHHRAHWEPNIKEVIREIIVPGSPALSKFDNKFNNNDNNDSPTSPATTDTQIAEFYHNRDTKSSVTKKSSSRFISIRGRSKSRQKSNADLDQTHNGVKRHWQLCMYVFGGKEQGANGVLNKQPITIWKLYI